ncbi:uncharacterized protein M6B38_299385 [Iris pallida]|uniref:Uncharacterized protein n=1 Tax=Iris pallida TaxID=29817 RepID=A0AAX6FUW5_IRIPA|nr:uncharacterized protein M6B38_399535 [Iris pallida]KAJ6842948.1 uncharacterized protein M6B38_299385 [Iris pallida]
MAEYAAMPSCTRVPWMPLQIQSRLNLSFPRNVYAKLSKREYYLHGKTYLTSRTVLLKVHEVCPPLCTAIRGSHCLNGSSLRCYCMGTLINPENVIPLSWASSVDEVLLVISVFFAYMAGAIPNSRTVPIAKMENSDHFSTASTSTAYGRCSENDRESDLNDCWGEVKQKILDALSAHELDGNLHPGAVDSEIQREQCPLSMLALAEGPRLRLLLATLQRLQKEAGIINDITQNQEVANQDIWLLIASKILKDSVRTACVKWLEDELSLKTGDPSMKLIDRISGKLKGDDTVSQTIDRTGKTELFADLLFFHRFGYVRTASFYDSRFLILYGVDILEDLVITMADGIASIYLDLISVDSNMSNEINSLGLALCMLSTRALQRLRNEVALNQWLQQNFASVVSMYEDQFELFILCSKKLEDPLESEKSVWSKIFTRWRLTTAPSFSYIQISRVFLPVKRTKELRALTGWRYYFSLFLEFSDITMPFIKTIFTKVSNAVSFFLVYMIGRSLGLIFSGIRQSLGWR